MIRYLACLPKRRHVARSLYAASVMPSQSHSLVRRIRVVAELALIVPVLGTTKIS